MELKNISVCEFMQAYNTRGRKTVSPYTEILKGFSRSGKGFVEVALDGKSVATCYRCLQNECTKNRETFAAGIAVIRRGSRIFLARREFFKK